MKKYFLVLQSEYVNIFLHTADENIYLQMSKEGREENSILEKAIRDLLQHEKPFRVKTIVEGKTLEYTGYTI